MLLSDVNEKITFRLKVHKIATSEINGRRAAIIHCFDIIPSFFMNSLSNYKVRQSRLTKASLYFPIPDLVTLFFVHVSL